MSKALVLGTAALALSAGAASAQVPGYDYYGATVPLYGYAAPVADLAPPASGTHLRLRSTIMRFQHTATERRHRPLVDRPLSS